MVVPANLCNPRTARSLGRKRLYYPQRAVCNESFGPRGKSRRHCTLFTSSLFSRNPPHVGEMQHVMFRDRTISNPITLQLEAGFQV